MNISKLTRNLLSNISSSVSGIFCTRRACDDVISTAASSNQHSDKSEIYLDQSNWRSLVLEAVGSGNIDEYIEINTSEKMTPLCLALKFGDQELAESLLNQCGASVNKGFSIGKNNAHGPSSGLDKHNIMTPLHYLAKYSQGENSASLAQLLVSNKATIDAKDQYGMTSLHYAVIYSNKDMVKLLISNGARVELEDDEGFTPQDLIEWCYKPDEIKTAFSNAQASVRPSPLYKLYPESEGALSGINPLVKNSYATSPETIDPETIDPETIDPETIDPDALELEELDLEVYGSEGYDSECYGSEGSRSEVPRSQGFVRGSISPKTTNSQDLDNFPRSVRESTAATVSFLRNNDPFAQTNIVNDYLANHDGCDNSLYVSSYSTITSEHMGRVPMVNNHDIYASSDIDITPQSSLDFQAEESEVSSLGDSGYSLFEGRCRSDRTSTPIPIDLDPYSG